jgi:hypothetical protein
MITLVTGLWDLGRDNLTEGWSRSYKNHYLKKLDELLKIKCNLIIFGDKELNKFVSERRQVEDTQFILRDLEWFKNNEFYNGYGSENTIEITKQKVYNILVDLTLN